MNFRIYGPDRAYDLKDAETKTRREAWSMSHSRCMVCWISESESRHRRYPGSLQTHEIVGGSMRSHETENYMRLCSACHHRYHSGCQSTGLSLSFGNMLYCKYEWACMVLGEHFCPNWIIPGVWNWHRIAYLYRPQRRPVHAVCLPCMESPQQAYLDERLLSHPGLRSPLPLGSPPSRPLAPEAYQEDSAVGTLLLKRIDCFATGFPPKLGNDGVLPPSSNMQNWKLISLSTGQPI